MRRLTPRELEVAALVAQDLSNAQIGAKLFIAPTTVRAHLERITDVLECRSRVGIAVWYVRTHTKD